MRKKRWPRLILSIVGLVILNSCMLLGIWLNPPRYFKHDIDVEPLVDAKIPGQVTSINQIIDPHLFGLPTDNDRNRLIWHIHLNDDAMQPHSYIYVYVLLELDNDKADHYYSSWTANVRYKKKYEAGGSGNNRYELSYWRQEQADAEDGSRYFSQFSSYGHFLKGSLLITIYESSDNKESRHMEEIIQKLAKELNK